MKTFVKGKASRILARLIVAAFVLCIGPAHAQPPNTASVIVFPLENKSETGGSELADRVTSALKVALEDSGQASLVSVDLSSPTVQRAIDVEKSLTQDDFQLPMDKDRAARIAKALGAQYAFLGSIEAYRFDQKANQASLTVTVLKVTPEGDSTAIGQVGRSGDHKEYTGGEGPLMTEAINGAAYQVVAAAFGPPRTAAAKPKAPAPGGKSGKSWEKWLLPLVLVAAVLIGSGGGHGEAKSAAPAVVTSAIGTPGSSSVQLSWAVGRAAGITGFNVYRGEAAQASPAATRGRFRARDKTVARQTTFSQLSNVDPSARSYTDSTAVAGTLYMYQIRANVSGGESTAATCQNYYNTSTNLIGAGVPQPPTGVTAGPGLGTVSILVSWNLSREPFVSSFRIYRAGNEAGPFTQVGEVGSGTTQFNNTSGLTAGAPYFFKVGAVGAAEALSGAVSASAQTGVPQPPSNLQAFSEQGQVRLTWVAPDDATVVGYNVYRNGSRIAQPSGIANTTYTDTNVTVGQTYTYTVRSRIANGTESVDSNAVVAGPGAPPDALQIAAQPTTIVANGTSTSTLTALVTGAGNPVAGVVVTFTTTLGTIMLSGQPHGTSGNVTTNAAGIAQCQLRSVLSGSQVSATVTASAPTQGGGTVSNSTSVTMGPATPATVVVTLSRSSVPGDGTSTATVTATVKDSGGSGVPSTSVAFSIAPALGAFNPLTANTNSSGQAQSTLTSLGGYGTCTITATAGSAQGTAQVTFAPPPTVTVSVTPSQLPAGGAGNVALITATVKYSTGDPVPDGTVIRFGFEPNTLTTSVTGARIASGEEHTTTHNGLAYSHLVSAPNLDNGNGDIVAAWNELNGDNVWTPGPEEVKGAAIVIYTQPPAHVTVTADPQTILADGVSTSKIIATVTTDIANPVGGGFQPVADGTPVTFTTSLGTFASTGGAQATATTVNGLTYVFLQAGSTSGTAQVSATAATVSGSVQVVLQPVTGYVVEMAAVPAALTADGTSTSTITATVRTKSGQAVSGVAVDWTAELGSVSPSTSQTDGAGRATTVLTAGRTAGTCNVIADVSSLSVVGTKLVALTSGEAARIDLTVQAPGVIPASNGLPSPSGVEPRTHITARVTDKFGNPVLDGTPVQFHTDIGQIQGTVFTSAGVATAELISSDFQTATNSATYLPGWASITARVEATTVTIVAGPVHVIFAGDPAVSLIGGGPNATNALVDVPQNGANFRLNPIGGSESLQPNLRPTAGLTWGLAASFFDANNNPVPSGTPIRYQIRKNGALVQEITTGTLPDGSSVPTSFQPTVLGDATGNASAAKYVIDVRCSAVASAGGALTIQLQQWVGAAQPSAITLTVAGGTTLADGSYTVTANVLDAFGNFAQTGTPVLWTALPGANATVSGLPASSLVANGRAQATFQFTGAAAGTAGIRAAAGLIEASITLTHQ